MESAYHTNFSDTILTSVFTGIIATLLCMAYYLGFKEITGFPLSSLINVSSLIFLINLLFLFIGFIYYFFIRTAKKGEVLFIILFVVLTIFSVLIAYQVNRSDIRLLNIQFHQLLAGIFIIIGISSFIGIPYLYNSRLFHEKVL